MLIVLLHSELNIMIILAYELENSTEVFTLCIATTLKRKTKTQHRIYNGTLFATNVEPGLWSLLAFLFHFPLLAMPFYGYMVR